MTKRRIVFAVLAVVMAVMIGSGIGLAEVKKISVDSDIVDVAPVSFSKETVVKAGDRITITATINNASNLSNPATAIMLDGKQFKFIKAEKGEVLGQQNKTSGISVINSKGPDRLMVRVTSIDKQSISGSGELYHITLKAMRDGKTKIDFVDMTTLVSRLNGTPAPQMINFEVKPAI